LNKEARDKGKRVLFVVEDDPALCELLRLSFHDQADQFVVSGDGVEAFDQLESGLLPSVILLDLMLPSMSGLDFLEKARKRFPHLKVIVISALSDVNTVVKAMQLGALDFVHKPFELEELRSLVEKAFTVGSPPSPATSPVPAPGTVPTPRLFLYNSQEMAAVAETMVKVAQTDIPILITGESGVGKEVVAREIHRLSTFASGPFVKVNCAALPASLLESELFGYEKGAFTGAIHSKPSKFENAANGTLLLDEIGELDSTLQAKFLHVLQDGFFNRLGSNRPVQSRARMVVATNRNLEAEVNHGNFRIDLFYRLNVVRIHIPPLRERPSDIVLLANHFLETYNRAHGRQLSFGSREMDLFMSYHWPGNVRELQNVIRRYVVLEHFGREDMSLPAPTLATPASTTSATPANAPPATTPSSSPTPLKELAKEAVRRAEREAILEALSIHNWNRTKTARSLKISYKALLYKIKDYRLANG
jgi:two-component system response regulator AtoC